MRTFCIAALLAGSTIGSEALARDYLRHHERQVGSLSRCLDLARRAANHANHNQGANYNGGNDNYSWFRDIRYANITVSAVCMPNTRDGSSTGQHDLFIAVMQPGGDNDRVRYVRNRMSNWLRDNN